MPKDFLIMVKIGKIEFNSFPLLLAPMEDVSDPPFRALCKENGADIVYTEFISSEGLIRDAIKSVQKLHNKDLDIEGLLLTMYDNRLRLSNQVVEEVKKHFGKMVFKTIIQRNIRLSEAPSFGEDIITYDASSRGAKSYLSLGSEIIKRNK